ncbi:MAG TPA: rhodanese-like domain-containing protein, partial [Chitinophagaceae bacterium]|nr:rhodanese-like domain-containing protein [Chitinophagaceae bacterium]
IGKLELEAIHTPGHTIESTCYLLRDENQIPRCLFTGDTLFVGDVGRPDLFSGSMSSTEMASMLYDSLEKIKKLPDEVIIYPAHGAGSSCGKNIGSETSSTIGAQKRTNYALLAQSRDHFIRQVIEGLSAPPEYFPLNASINKGGYTGLDEVMGRSLRPLSVTDFSALVREGAFILDTRKAEDFAEGFIPKSLQIGLNGRFAEWAAILVPFDRPLVLVVEPGMEAEVVTRLARVGFDQVSGYLEGGIGAWKAAGQKTDMVVTVDGEELALDLPFDPGLLVLDVRRQVEYAEGHVRGAMNLDLNEMTRQGPDLKSLAHRNIYVHCESGYRSMIACSILKKAGLQNLRNVNGGFSQLKLLTTIPKVTVSSVLN